jgi:hypothetical protein
MGLDWMLDAHKAKPGCEKQYRRIIEKLHALEHDKSIDLQKSEHLRRDLEVALKQVAISPAEVMGAPRVGVDEEATEWFRINLYLPAQVRVADEKTRPVPRDPSNPRWDDRNDDYINYWDRPFDTLVQAEHGKYVVELAKEREGLAPITGILCSLLDFRGKAVALAVALDEGLRNEAYDDHDADACLDYAERLEAAVAEYKAEHPDWATRKEEAEYGGQVSANDDIVDVEAAVRWLRYWGSRGFGFSGWY